MADILINDQKMRCLFDTGAEINLLPTEFAKKLCLALKSTAGVQPVSVDQTPVRCEGVAEVRVRVGQNKQLQEVKFYVVHGIEYGIISFPLLTQLGAVTDCGLKTVKIGNTIIGNAGSTIAATSAKTAKVCRVRLSEPTVIHPGQERFLSASFDGEEKSPFGGSCGGSTRVYQSNWPGSSCSENTKRSKAYSCLCNKCMGPPS